MRSSTVRKANVDYEDGRARGIRRGLARALLSAALLVLCGGAAVAVHRAVASEWLDDTTSLVVTVATALGLGAVALGALRHTLRRANWRRRLAMAVVPAGLSAICAGFIVAGLPDASVEMEAIVEAHGPASPPATVELGPLGDDVRLSGEIQEGVAKRLAALLDTHPRVTRIALTSEGGLADEGQAIGDVIAAHKLATFVPDFCVSACTLAFVRGRERLVMDDSRVGFHAPFETGLFGALYQGDSSTQRAQYLAAGLAGDFVDAALKVKPDDVWYPTPARLLAAHVATAMVGHDRLPDSSLDGAATLDGARAFVLRGFPLLDAFRARSPGSVDAVASWYLDSYRRQRPEAENQENLRAIVDGAALLALTRADDAALLAAGRFLARGMAAAADPEACLRIGGGIDLVEAAAQLGRFESGSRSDADKNNADKTNADVTNADLRAIVTAAAAGHRVLRGAGDGGPLEALTEADADAAGCAAARRAYEALLRRPSAEAAAALRRFADAQARDSLAALRIIVAARR